MANGMTTGDCLRNDKSKVVELEVVEVLVWDYLIS